MASFIEVSDQVFIDISKHGAESVGDKDMEAKCTSFLEKEDYSSLFNTLLTSVNAVLQKTKESGMLIFTKLLKLWIQMRKLLYLFCYMLLPRLEKRMN